MVVLLVTVLTACGTTTKVQRMADFSLRSCENIYLKLIDATGGISYDVAQKISGVENASQVLQSLEFEMSAIGFKPQRKVEQASCIGEFSIMGIRRDPLAGWIADQAILKILDKDEKVLMTIKGSSQFITPTIDNIISNISDEIRDNFK